MTDTIVRISAKGEGVTADGRHAAFTAPGDTVDSAGFVVAGPHHQTPPCRHFPECGGCQLQHLDEASFATFVGERIVGALAAKGLSTDVRAPSISPSRSRRRTTLHADGRGGRIVLGFAASRSHAIVDMQECHILAPELFALVAPLRRLLRTLGLKRKADVHLTLADQGADVLIRGITADGLAAADAISAFCTANRVARFAIESGDGPETRWEPESVTITLGGVAVPLPPAAFLQATREGEAALVSAVREAVGAPTTVADLFAGLGTFTFALPAKVYAAEGARDALMALKAAANRTQRPIFPELRDLYRRPLTVAELDRFDAVVIDPPRAGAREQTAAIAQKQRGVIAYVSCDPSTFARDAAELCEHGWTLDWVQPVGQFLWSTHVELAARFSK